MSPHGPSTLLDLTDAIRDGLGRVRLAVAGNGHNHLYAAELDRLQDLAERVRCLTERRTGEYPILSRTKADTTPDQLPDE
jgi:hypothetical protein